MAGQGFAQAPLLDSRVVIGEGVKLHNTQKLDEAVQQYLLVTENDTNFYLAQSELALTYFQQKKYEDALKAANNSLAAKNESKVHALLLKGNTLSEMGNTAEALKVFDQALKDFPYAQMIHYNKAIVYIKQEKFKEAIEELQKELQTNFLHSSSHLALARLMARQDQPAHAALSFIHYFMLEPASGRSNENLVYFENLMAGNARSDDEKPIAAFTSNNAFKEMDLLITSRVALDKKYKAKVDFNAALVKQVQLILEKANYVPNTGDFWMDYYMPTLVTLQKENQLVPLTYLMLTSTGKVSKWQDRNKKALDKFRNIGKTALYKRQDDLTISLNGTPTKVECWFYDDGKLSGLGNVEQSNRDNRTGPWTFFYRDGAVSAEGNFLNGKKVGEWKYYGYYNNLSSIENYNQSGEQEGVYKRFHNNGQVSALAMYKADKVDGEVKIFYPCGTLMEAYSFKNSEKNGPGMQYYRTGQKETDYTMLANAFEGTVTGYYVTGEVNYITLYKGGTKNGNYKEYFPNGILKVEGSFVNGNHSGAWRFYHPNGKLKTEGNFTNDVRTGNWKEYHSNGKLAEAYELNAKGELHNQAHYYDEDGKLHYQALFQNGLVKEGTYFSKDGKELSKSVTKGKILDFKAYDPNGLLSFTRRFVNGQPDGETRYLYKNGSIKTTQHYSKGQLHGISKEYHFNGQLKSELNYTNGQADGYYKEYSLFGVLLKEGWMRNDKRQGDWVSYHANGKPESRHYYIDGTMHGLSHSYAANGTLVRTTRFDLGEALFMSNMDSTGKELSRIDYVKGDTQYKILYPNGSAQVQAPMSCGNVDGKLEWLSPSGKVTGYAFFKNDNREGDYESYYESGKLHIKGSYQEGLKHGPMTWYYESGTVLHRQYFTQGEQDSVWTRYHENGKLSAELTYRMGTLEGPARYMDPQGQLIIEKYFDGFGMRSFSYLKSDGTMSEPQVLNNYNGPVKAYFANGKPSVEETYLNGEQEGKSTYYYSNGKPYLVRNYASGEYHGQYEEYWENGNLKLREHFVHGIREGVSEAFYENGAPEKKEEYLQGDLFGKAMYYSRAGKLLKTKNYWNGQEYETKQSKGI